MENSPIADILRKTKHVCKLSMLANQNAALTACSSVVYNYNHFNAALLAKLLKNFIISNKIHMNKILKMINIAFCIFNL